MSLQAMDQRRTSQLSPCLKLWLLLASYRARIKIILLKSIPLPTPNKWQFNEAVNSDLEVVIQKEAELLLSPTVQYSHSQLMPLTKQAVGCSLGNRAQGIQGCTQSKSQHAVPALALLEPCYSPEGSSSHLREIKK